ncbi:P-loop NTPase fold protein [Pelagibius sp.]|uniref:KAP family P-loop NTPase fold protein n=1 Tax=Pelagibius sp. TaxID=1931238 RepID=UPI002602A312|nr:P-loop NTPase fold protein [Pelagibius sp.]
MEGSGFPSFSGQPLSVQSLTLLGDGAHTVDLLGYQPYVDALVEVLAQQDLQTPFAVGVFGRWGTGKSTFMNLLREPLSIEERAKKGETGGFHCVVFHPWQFEEKEEVWKALLLSVIRYLEAVEARRTTRGEDEARKIKETLRTLALSVGRLALNKTIHSMTSGVLTFDQMIEAYSKTARENANFINTFRKQFGELKKQILAGGEGDIARLFVFVDDLDRCTPDNCIMVLEAIKLFFDLQECVFILGIDREVVQRGIEQKYKDSIGIHGQDYLDKLIQLPFSLPPIQPKTFKRFVETMTRDFDFSEEIRQLIVRAADGNPRLAKRLSNCLQLTRTVARRLAAGTETDEALVGGQFDDAKFALLLTLQVRYPVAYLWLTRNPLTRSELVEGWESASGGAGYRSRLETFLKDAWGDSIAGQNADGFYELWRHAESKEIGVGPFKDHAELEAYMRITGVVEEGRAWDQVKGRQFTADEFHDHAYETPEPPVEPEPIVKPDENGHDKPGRDFDTEAEAHRSLELLDRAKAILGRWNRFESWGVVRAPLVLPRIVWRVERLLDDAERMSADIRERIRDMDARKVDGLTGRASELDGLYRDLRRVEPRRAYGHVRGIAAAFMFVCPLSMAVIGYGLELLLGTLLPLIAPNPEFYLNLHARLFDGSFFSPADAGLAPMDAALRNLGDVPWAFPGGPMFCLVFVGYMFLSLVVWNRTRRRLARLEQAAPPSP